MYLQVTLRWFQQIIDLLVMYLQQVGKANHMSFLISALETISKTRFCWKQPNNCTPRGTSNGIGSSSASQENSLASTQGRSNVKSTRSLTIYLPKTKGQVKNLLTLWIRENRFWKTRGTMPRSAWSEPLSTMAPRGPHMVYVFPVPL